MFVVTNNVVILLITTIVNFVAAAVSWQRKNTRSGLYFAIGMLGITFWTLSVGLGYAAASPALKLLFAKLEYTAYNAAFTCLALFALSYAGYENWLEKAPLRIFFYAIPVSNILLAWTNELHGWLWTGFLRSGAGNNDLTFEHGPAYLWVTITSYLMVLFIVVPLWHASRRGVEFSRRQARLLFFASLIPIIGNLSYVFETPEFNGVNLTSIMFSMSSLLFSLALYGTRLLDLVPIARDKVVAGLSDGMIVLDVQGRIIDMNHVAASLSQSSSESLIGEQLIDVMPQLGRIFEQPPVEDIRMELEIGKDDLRFFDVLISPLRDKNRMFAGHLIIFRDITDRKQVEKDLERRFLEVQGLNRDLKETQTQLVEQQRVLAALEERQRLARDLHDSVNQSIHGMVLFADTLASALEKNNMPRALHIMERLRESANQSLRETRLMLYELQETGSERNVDLIRDMQDRLSMVESRAGIETQLIEEGSLDDCPLEWRENLFWIAVEAMNNSLKHSHASKVQIVFRFSSQRVQMEIIDNGNGFDPLQVKTGGMGLKNLRDRAELLGGTLTINSKPSNGTTVCFSSEIKAKQYE